MEDAKTVSTPIEAGTKFTKGDIKENDESTKQPYRELIGALNYLAVASRPDISHVVSCLS